MTKPKVSVDISELSLNKFFIGGIAFFPFEIIKKTALFDRLVVLRSLAPDAPSWPSIPWQDAQCFINKNFPFSLGELLGSIS